MHSQEQDKLEAKYKTEQERKLKLQKDALTFEMEKQMHQVTLTHLLTHLLTHSLTHSLTVARGK